MNAVLESVAVGVSEPSDWVEYSFSMSGSGVKSISIKSVGISTSSSVAPSNQSEKNTTVFFSPVNGSVIMEALIFIGRDIVILPRGLAETMPMISSPLRSFKTLSCDFLALIFLLLYLSLSVYN